MDQDLNVQDTSTQADAPAAGTEQQDTGQGQIAEAANQAAEGAPQQEISLADLAKRFDNIQREMGRFRGLQSQFDSLPKTIDSTLSKRLEQMQREQYLNTLSPEARLSYQEQQQGQEQLKNFVMQVLGEKFPGLADRYGDFTKFYERMSTQIESQDWFDQVSEALGPDAEKAIPEVTKLLKELNAKVSSLDPAEAQEAAKLRDLYANNPHAAALAVARRMQQRVQGAANGVIDARRASAGKSAIVPQGSANMKPPTRLTKAQMNDKGYLESIAGNYTTEQWAKLLADSRA